MNKLSQTIKKDDEEFIKKFDETYRSVRSYTAGQMQDFILSNITKSRIKELEALVETIGEVVNKSRTIEEKFGIGVKETTARDQVFVDITLTLQNTIKELKTN